MTYQFASSAIRACSGVVGLSAANRLQHPFWNLQRALHFRAERRTIGLAVGAALEVGAGSLAQVSISQDVDASGRQHAGSVDSALQADAGAMTGSGRPGMHANLQGHSRHAAAHRRRTPTD
ncbi:MAG TPA: hypothetical protein VFV38_01870, partial [Ktedonobacteraceae bacterium]|nr:hypothetical protein [Ktedonobacteraceae bacterium]